VPHRQALVNRDIRPGFAENEMQERPR